MRNQKSLFIFTIVFVLIVSCNSQAQIIPTEINRNTVAPIATINNITITSTPSLSPTQLLPTIPPSDLLESWLDGNPNCLFPCWAGITPGQTSWEDAFTILSTSVASNTTPLPLTSKCKHGSCYSFSWQYFLDDVLYSGIIFEKDNLIYSISISGENSIKYDIYEVLENYGQPDEVFLSASSFTPEGEPYVILILLYESRKFVARYMWWATFEANKIKACGISEIFSIGIVDIEPGNWTGFDISRGGYQSVQGATIENFKPLSEVSEFSVSSFYESATQTQENFCISTFTSYWK